MSSVVSSASQRSPLLTMRLRFGLIIALCALAAIAIRAGFLAHAMGLEPFAMVDIHAFYITGKLFHEGLIDKAYDFSVVLQAQKAFSGSTSFMPWTYPPPFNLVTALLATMPFVVAYIVFVSSTYAAYAAVLYHLRPQAFAFAMWLGFTTAIVMIVCGQNGFLTAAILGLFCLLYLRGSLWGGAVLGLMVIKPHLAVGVGLWLLFRKEFAQLSAAAATALALCALATLIMGPSVWTAFLAATAEAGAYLRDGEYMLYRMVSAYAGLRSAGAPSQLAMGAHVALAAAAVAVIFLAALREADRSVSLGVAILCSFFISPYVYDYDLPLMAVAFILLWPALAGCAGNGAIGAIVALAWIAGGSGLLSFLPSAYLDHGGSKPVALGWIFMTALAALTLRTLYPRAIRAMRVRAA